MPVLAGVAIPKTAPDMEASKALVAYMLKPETQIATLRATNFFPVMEVDLPDDMPASVKAFGPAIAKMSGAARRAAGAAADGAGRQGRPVQPDLHRHVRADRAGRAGHPDRCWTTQAGQLTQLMNEANAPCWAPDKPSDGPCPVN